MAVFRAAAIAAAIRPGDVVLEPAAGTGLLASQAENRRPHLLLNELAEIRAEVLAGLFGDCAVTRYDAAHIHDHLDAGLVPSVVLMNPPFSAVAHVDRMRSEEGRGGNEWGSTCRSRLSPVLSKKK